MPNAPPARKGDPTNHAQTPGGVIGPPLAGPCAAGPVLVENLPAGHVLCSVVCSGAPGVHYPGLPPGNCVVAGTPTVLVHNMPAARWGPSGDLAACTAELGLAALTPTRRTLIGGASKVSTIALARSLITTASKNEELNELLEAHLGADEADAMLVAEDLAQLPAHVLQLMVDKECRVVVVRGSITQYLPERRGESPGGEEGLRTYDDVPGMAGNGEAIVAVEGHGTPEGPHLASQGGQTVAMHEVGHVLDDVTFDENYSEEPGQQSAHLMSQNPEFLAARYADEGDLSEYEQTAGARGPQETFASAFARYHADDPTLAEERPALYEYFENDPWKQ